MLTTGVDSTRLFERLSETAVILTADSPELDDETARELSEDLTALSQVRNQSFKSSVLS